MTQRIRTWMALLLCVLFVLGCSDAAIEVNVTGLTPDVKSLLVSVTWLDRPAAQVIQPVTGRIDSFKLQVSTSSAQLQITVGGIGDTGCRVAEGTIIQDIPTAGPIEIALTPLSAPGCSISVDLIGDGQGRVVSDPAGIDCPTTCSATFVPGTPVTLRAIPASDAAFFSGWSQSCSGGGLCQLRISDSQSAVRAGFLPSKVCRGVFCWEAPLPQGNSLRAVYVRSDQDAWAIGDGGTILHWFGSTWAPVRSSTSVALWGIYGKGEELWVVGDGGTILKYDGRQFAALTSSTNANLHAIAGNGTDVFIAGDGGTLLRWSGSTFSPITNASKENLRGLSVSSSEVWAVGENGTAVRYKNGRLDVIPTGVTATLNSVAERVSGETWLAGEGGTLLKWNGSSFAAQALGSSLSMYALWVTPNGELWGAAGFGTLRRFDGTTWTSYGASAAQNLFAIHGSASNEAWAAGESGLLVHWNGVTWTPLQNQAPDSVLAIGSMDGTTLHSIGASGAVRQRISGVWHKIDGGPGFSVTSAWIGTGEIWAVSGNLLLRFAVVPPKTSPRWTVYNLAPYNLTAVGRRSYDPSGAKIDAFAVSLEGVLFGLTGAPSAPTIAQRTLVGTPLNAIASTTTTDGWTVGDLGIAIHLVGTFAIASPTGTTAQLSSVFGLASDDVWAVGELGTILHYNGIAWSKVSSGTTGQLSAVWASSATDVWVVGEKGIVLNYDGKNFSRVSAGTSSKFFAVGPGENSTVTVAGESGAILRGGRASYP